MSTPRLDYPALKREFITTEVSLRELAKREGVSNSTISAVARRPDDNGKTWVALRDDYQAEVERRYLSSQAESRARQLSRLADLSVNVLEAALTRLAIQLAGNPGEDGVPTTDPMEVPIKEGLEVIRSIQTLRGLPGNITEERQVIGHLADPRIVASLGEIARQLARPGRVDVSPPRALLGPAQGPAGSDEGGQRAG